MTAKQLIKLLNQNGYSEIRQRGSHKIFQGPDGKMVTVPCHSGKDLKPGTLNQILKDAGLK